MERPGVLLYSNTLSRWQMTRSGISLLNEDALGLPLSFLIPGPYASAHSSLETVDLIAG
jgi:hypothetical protein